jgi:uncharacterized protein (TIGR02646 family)
MKQIVKKYTFPDETPSFKSWKDGKKLSKTHLQARTNLKNEKKGIWKKFTGNKTIKNAVKKDLLDEQGYICCYCQSEINMDEKTQIEHFVARSSDPTKMFDYDNLLAGCNGGQQSREDNNQTEKIERISKFCCHKKGDKTLLISPLEQTCEDHFDYVVEGSTDDIEISIKGKTAEGTDAVEKLNLNVPYLKRERGRFFKLSITNDDGENLDKGELTRVKTNIFNRINNRFIPFCVAIDSVFRKYNV